MSKMLFLHMNSKLPSPLAKGVKVLLPLLEKRQYQWALRSALHNTEGSHSTNLHDIVLAMRDTGYDVVEMDGGADSTYMLSRSPKNHLVYRQQQNRKSLTAAMRRARAVMGAYQDTKNSGYLDEWELELQEALFFNSRRNKPLTEERVRFLCQPRGERLNSH